ncbi:ABC transporter substrate-binding protein [Actinocorallia aurea]
MTSRFLTALAGAGLALTLAACGGGETKTPAAASGPFVYSFNLDIVTEWDPATSYSNEIIAMQNMYESLTRYNAETQKVEPLLATDWKSSDDGKKWTFTLRDGVEFHTGNPLTAQAAKESLERTIAKAGGAAYIWDSVKKISAPDDKTLVFDLKYAAPLDLISAADYGAYIYDPSAKDAWYGEGNDSGTGPFTAGEWNKGAETELTLDKVDGYWGGWEGAHYTSVEFRVTPQVTTAWQQLQTGDVDFVQRLNPQLFEQAESTPGIETSQTPSFQNLLALFNTASGPLADVQLRKAVQAAIDYDGLVAALKGSVTAASGIVPEGLTGYASGLEGKQDLTEATRLLNQAGYGPGKKKLTLSLTYAQGDDDQQTFVTLLSSALKGLNVELDAKPMQWDAQWSRAKAEGQRQDIFVMYWYPDYPDAYSWFANVLHSADPVSFNLTYLEDAEIDTAIDALPEQSATDREGAQTAFTDLQNRLLGDLAVAAPLFVQQYQRAYTDDVTGYTDNPAYPNVVFVHDVKPGA